MQTRACRALMAVVAGALLTTAGPASADIGRFDLAGRIYTKWMYQNDDSQGTLTLGTPFPQGDNFSGGNGVGTEFELKIMGAVSNAVRAEVRLKSRFGSLWQDWWENGDRADQVDLSGESLGMNHAEYVKLRGYSIDANLPIPSVRSVLIGSSDLGMFNAWTIGKVRYIDRDNAKGTFITGGTDDGLFGYVAAVIALPKLFVGPGWTTGVSDPKVRNPFWSRDWAYAAKLTLEPLDIGTFTLIGSLTRDTEIDVADPDAQGALYPDCLDALGNPIAGCDRDHSVETLTRYSNAVATLQYQGVLFDILGIDAVVALSWNDVNEDLADNGVSSNQGISPIVYKDAIDHAAVLRLELYDPFEIGLSLKLEGFSIGEHFNTIFGARRESDVLLTEGLLDGDQLPTLNLANEFMDFDEDFVESAIGWYGVTLVPEFEADWGTLSGEFTWIGYHTDAQDRDVDEVYPDFLFGDGFTDTDLYDYANTFKRGRDPRAAYRRNQDRDTFIGVLTGRFEPELPIELGFDLKFKTVYDVDARSHTVASDDYKGLKLVGRFAVDTSLADSLSLGVGTQIEWWDEENRSGTLEQGYGDDTTLKAKAFVKATYSWSGFNFGYLLEYVHKSQRLQRDDNNLWHVIRSKATVEVQW